MGEYRVDGCSLALIQLSHNRVARPFRLGMMRQRNKEIKISSASHHAYVLTNLRVSSEFLAGCGNGIWHWPDCILR